MKTEAIVAAAGAGKRLMSRIRKPYREILGKPILIHTLQVLSRCAQVNRIIVAVNRSDEKMCLDLIGKYRIKKIKAVIHGGSKRSGSVFKALKRLDKDTDIVLIHDGVRPFISDVLIRKSIDCAHRFGACIAGVPVKATIKKVQGSPRLRSGQARFKVQGGMTVERTVDRSDLWEAQTPQVFKKGLLLKAYKNYRSAGATDDAMLVERLGVKVRIIMGSYLNIKITTPEDLVIGEAILRAKSVKSI